MLNYQRVPRFLRRFLQSTGFATLHRLLLPGWDQHQWRFWKPWRAALRKCQWIGLSENMVPISTNCTYERTDLSWVSHVSHQICQWFPPFLDTPMFEDKGYSIIWDVFLPCFFLFILQARGEGTKTWAQGCRELGFESCNSAELRPLLPLLRGLRHLCWSLTA